MNRHLTHADLIALKPVPGIGMRIANTRKRKGILQGELADQVGTTAKRIRDFETGAAVPPPIMRFAMARALGVRPVEFDAPDLVEVGEPGAERRGCA